MKEIHLSKNTFCSFLNKETDHQYDIILFDTKEINYQNIILAKQNKVARILRETGEKVNIDNLPTTNLVFRIMTWEHIPMLPPKISKSEKMLAEIVPGKSIDRFFDSVIDNDDFVLEDEDDDLESLNIVPLSNLKADHIRINFPPFYNYRFDENNILRVVAKSHWIGDLDNGQFCKTHGYFTDTLARMIMKLTDKYASKGNWRNYSYVEEFKGQAVMQLCQVALQFDESKSANPFAFFTSICHNSFLRILNIEKKNQQIRDDLLIKNSMNPSYSRTNKDINSYDGGYE